MRLRSHKLLENSAVLLLGNAWEKHNLYAGPIKGVKVDTLVFYCRFPCISLSYKSSFYSTCIYLNRRCFSGKPRQTSLDSIATIFSPGSFSMSLFYCSILCLCISNALWSLSCLKGNRLISEPDFHFCVPWGRRVWDPWKYRKRKYIL